MYAGEEWEKEKLNRKERETTRERQTGERAHSSEREVSELEREEPKGFLCWASSIFPLQYFLSSKYFHFCSLTRNLVPSLLRRMA